MLACHECVTVSRWHVTTESVTGQALLSLSLSLDLTGVSRKQVPSYQASTGKEEPLRPMSLMRSPVRAPLTMLRRRVTRRLTACTMAWSRALLCRVGRFGWM